MFKQIEKWKVRLWVFLMWRKNSPALLEAIRRFEVTEDDSAWHLLRGVYLTENPVDQADLFGQVLEEVRHAEEFRHLYRNLSGKKIRRIVEEKKALFHTREDSWKLFAQCLVGEEAASTRFSAIVEANPHPDLLRLLKRILADEEGHIEKASNLIKSNEGALDPQTQNIRREVKAIRRRRLWEAWLRTGRQLTQVLSTLILKAVYFVFVGPFSPVARKRLGYYSVQKNAALSTNTGELYERPRPIL